MGYYANSGASNAVPSYFWSKPKVKRPIFIFPEQATLNSRSRWTPPIPSNFNKTVGSVCADKKVYFKGIDVYILCLAREFWQVCEWDLIGFELHNLRIVLCDAKKLKVVLPVNASSSYYPFTVCVMCPKRICSAKPFFIRTVSKDWPCVLVLDISVFEWWGNKIVRDYKESIRPYVQCQSNGKVLIYT